MPKERIAEAVTSALYPRTVRAMRSTVECRQRTAWVFCAKKASLRALHWPSGTTKPVRFRIHLAYMRSVSWGLMRCRRRDFHSQVAVE